MIWKIIAIRHDSEHVIADLRAEDDGSDATVYLTAGLLATLGRRSTPLYDGKVPAAKAAKP